MVRHGSHCYFCILWLFMLLISSVLPCEFHHYHDDDNNDSSSGHGNLRSSRKNKRHLITDDSKDNNNNNSNNNNRRYNNNTIDHNYYHRDTIGNEEEEVEITEECGFINPTDEEIAIDQAKMIAWLKQRSSQNIMDRTSTTSGGGRLYVIPTYFHIIQPSTFAGLVSLKRIQDYVTYLNNAFRNSNAPFIFDYKNATRTFNSNWGNSCGLADIEYAYKSKLKIGGAESLNVYICNRVPNRQGEGSLAGYSFLPTSDSNSNIRDGVVLSYSTSDQRLNTLVHEVGHFMGLYHTFADSTCDPNSYGDGVDDTPQHLSKASEINCHSDPKGWDTCPNRPGKDPVDNYMTYSSDNFCRTRFTPGQVERMIAQYELYRLPYLPVPTPQVPIVPAPVSPPTTRRPVPRPTPPPVPRPKPAPTPAPTPYRGVKIPPTTPKPTIQGVKIPNTSTIIQVVVNKNPVRPSPSSQHAIIPAPTPAPTYRGVVIPPSTPKPTVQGVKIPNTSTIIQLVVGKNPKPNTATSCKKFLDICRTDDECCSGNCFAKYTTVLTRCWYAK